MSPASLERRRDYMREWRAKHPGYGVQKQRAYRSGGYLRRLKVRIERTARRIERLNLEVVSAERELERLRALQRDSTCFGCGKFALTTIERNVALPGQPIERRMVPYCGAC